MLKQVIRTSVAGGCFTLNAKKPVNAFAFTGFWQGQKDSNPRHAVLETAALPAELYPFILLPRSPGALLLYQKTVCLSTSIFDFFAIFSVLLSGQKVVCRMVKNEPFRQIPKGLYHGAAKQI